MDRERRRYIRLDTEVKFTYKKKGSRGKKNISITKNISSGGIRGLVNSRIKKGDWLELAMKVRILKKPINAIGKVVWTADKKGGKINVGIKFEEIDADLKNRFLEYICELMFYELERLKV